VKIPQYQMLGDNALVPIRCEKRLAGIVSSCRCS